MSGNIKQESMQSIFSSASIAQSHSGTEINEQRHCQGTAEDLSMLPTQEDDDKLIRYFENSRGASDLLRETHFDYFIGSRVSDKCNVRMYAQIESDSGKPTAVLSRDEQNVIQCYHVKNHQTFSPLSKENLAKVIAQAESELAKFPDIPRE